MAVDGQCYGSCVDIKHGDEALTAHLQQYLHHDKIFDARITVPENRSTFWEEIASTMDEKTEWLHKNWQSQSSAITTLDDKLKLIAHELLVKLKDNLSVDWARRDAARARMRVLVKRILRHYGYPPDLQDAAVQTVLQQAEQLSSTWTLPGYAGSM